MVTSPPRRWDGDEVVVEGYGERFDNFTRTDNNDNPDALRAVGRLYI